MTRLALAVLTALLLTAAPASAVEGNFLVGCTLDGARTADPIGGATHVHDFAGAVGITNASTPFSLLTSPSTCKPSGETPGFWHPAMVKPDGTRIDYESITIYYRNPDVSQGKVMPFPFGLKHLYGDPSNNDPNHYAAIWRCYGSGTSSAYIPASCPSYVQEDLYFNFCWDGLSLDAPGHHTLQPCDAAHPIRLPAINVTLFWPPGSAGSKLTSDVEHGTGPGLSAHADYWFTVNPFFFAKVVERCLNAGIQCRVAGAGQAQPQGSVVNVSVSPPQVVVSAAEASAF